MDLIKKLTGKNPSEYEPIAKSLVDNSDTELFSKLVKQDDFLFDFIKDNVAKRLQRACNKDNYKNLLPLMKYYSPSYDTMFGEILHSFGGDEIYADMKNLYLDGTDSEKAYAAKYFSFNKNYADILPEIRKNAQSEFEPLGVNSTELLSIIKDDLSKNEALKKLDSEDEFEQYEGVKFLVNYGAKDAIDKIIEVMKKSRFSENIASEIPYLINIDELLKRDFDNGILVLCNIINAMPEIISLSAVLDYGLFELFENLYCGKLTSTSALLLRMAKEKFEALAENEEYLYDCDRNTKDEILAIRDLLSGVNENKLNSLLYDELYEESDFVFFALEYADEIGELEELLDSKNQTLVLKVLTILKEKGALTEAHKKTALGIVTSEDIKQIINSL